MHIFYSIWICVFAGTRALCNYIEYLGEFSGFLRYFYGTLVLNFTLLMFYGTIVVSGFGTGVSV
jgi:hypothetical protein